VALIGDVVRRHAMYEIPIHIKKLTKEYAAGSIKPEDVALTPSADEDVTKDTYAFTLPTFDVLGDPVGEHEFALTLESLVETKNRVLEELAAYTSKVDALVADYNALIDVLQDVKNKKDVKKPG
jgi:hypothetical protein